MKKEVWKDVVGYEGLYQISDMGRVKRPQRVSIDSMGRKVPYKEKILKNKISKQTGYPCVNLSKNGKVTTLNIHTLIADAFIPNPDNLPCINHKDENRANSVLSNLERCTYSYNNAYGTACDRRTATLRNGLRGKHKTIYQYDLNGNLIAKYDCGVSQLKEILGYDVETNLIGNSKTAHGFVFSYDNKFEYKEDLPKAHQKYVILLDSEGNEIKRYKSVSEAARENGVDRHVFSRNKPTNGIVVANGKRFFVEKKEHEYIPKGHKGARPDLKGKGSKKISQYTLDGTYIRDYNSVIEAASLLGDACKTTSISSCLTRHLKSAIGFQWRYADEDTPASLVGSKKHKINQFTKDGKYVATYNSIKEANDALGTNGKSNIYGCLVGLQDTAYGYIWKYAIKQ